MVDAVGLLYTHNRTTGGHIVERDATLLAIPFIICAGPFTDEGGYRKLMTAYCLILALASLYCLGIAVQHYIQVKEIYVFFYHTFSHAIRENAIYFSVFMIFGLLYLLSPRWDIDSKRLSPKVKSGLRIGMILFFTGSLSCWPPSCCWWCSSSSSYISPSSVIPSGKNKKFILALIVTGLLLIAGVVFTDNPSSTGTWISSMGISA